MSIKQQIRIPATYMRGGTSKGVFFNLLDFKFNFVIVEVNIKLKICK